MNKNYMKAAITAAWKYQFLTYPNPAVGACVTRNGKILSAKAHKESGKPHAEVNALKFAFLQKNPLSPLKKLESSFDIHNFLIQNHNNFFHDCEIYVTLEPCNHIGKTPSCASLLKEIKIKKVYIGSLDLNKIASNGIQTLKNSNIEVETEILKKECDELLAPFVKWNKNDFKFFKLAIRQDGSCDGGYITTQDSLNLVHEIRTKIDLLVIGGNTVRNDRPTLDARFSIEKKASDILIYSNKIDFDKEINLFKVENRNVFISNELNSVPSKFSMIEGGYQLLESIKTDIDMLMLFVSHKDKLENNYDFQTYGLNKVYSYFINETDEVVFYTLTKRYKLSLIK